MGVRGRKRQSFDGLRPVFFVPRTLVRTWGTRSELVGVEEWITRILLFPRGSATPVAGFKQSRTRGEIW
jgi:hypothetical protein